LLLFAKFSFCLCNPCTNIISIFSVVFERKKARRSSYLIVYQFSTAHRLKQATAPTHTRNEKLQQIIILIIRTTTRKLSVRY
jgi:hypothetical protein